MSNKLHWLEFYGDGKKLKCPRCEGLFDSLFINLGVQKQHTNSIEQAQRSHKHAKCPKDSGFDRFQIGDSITQIVLGRESEPEKPSRFKLVDEEGPEFPYGEFGGADQVSYERFARSNYPEGDQ